MPHDRAHDHTPLKDLGQAFRWAVGRNTAYVIVEAAAGLRTGALALLADAAHNLTDGVGLLIASALRFWPNGLRHAPMVVVRDVPRSWRRC